MGLQGAVDEPDGGVDDALRVDDHLDRLVRDIVQPVRFDDLQALVRERRRVDGDLVAHRPGRVTQGGVGGRRRELIGRRVEERTARGGQDQCLDRGHRLTDEALPQRRMLRIDRAKPGQRARERVARSRGRGLRGEPARLGHDQVPSRDERFLVRRRDDLARRERRQHRPQADDAARGHDDEVDVVARRELDQRGVGRRHGRCGRAQSRDLLLQPSPVRARRQRDRVEGLGMRDQDVDDLTPDRAGRPEKGDAAGPRR